LLQIGDIEIEVRHTPGHTSGCVSYVLADRVFTGDALLIGGSGRTDFQQGNAGQLYDSITAKLFTLPADTLVYPGHDYHGNTVSTIKQEMAKNPRIGQGRSRNEFIDIMQELKLAYPRFIDQALPANQSCGSIATEQ
jgi:glyoxylase-like metal-dependent hydrolase (beta-lactamase superfamily II)